MLKPIVLTFLGVISIALPLDAHFLWRVESEKPSYLYGTVHSSDPLVRELPAEVTEALKNSDSFHPELEFSPENLGRLTAAIFAQAGTDLENELPTPLWERLLSNAQRMGIPTGLLRRIPVQLTPLLFAAPPGVDFNRVVDIQVYTLARENELSIRQLETVEEQLAVFRNLDRDQAIALLEEALEEFEGGFPTQKKILRKYAAGDLDGLSEFLAGEFSRLEIPGLEQQLIDQRNRRMVERLTPYLEEGGAFAAVGVGHMPGENGMIALLEERGFKISRVELQVSAPAP